MTDKNQKVMNFCPTEKTSDVPIAIVWGSASLVGNIGKYPLLCCIETLFLFGFCLPQ